MTKTKTPPLAVIDLVTQTQESTPPSFYSDIDPLGTSTSPTFKELLEKYNVSVEAPKVAWADLKTDESVNPFTLHPKNLATAKPQPVRWLWQERLPLAGVTLLDGDHGTGKSLLALQIAASVSSGSRMPDGTETLQGGVVIVSPVTDASTQLQLLTTLKADLSRIEILSFIQEPESHTGGSRPFSLPGDFIRLFEAIKRVKARLIIFDPFIPLLSRERRCTNENLCHLLIDLNQHLIEHNVACLLIRNCGAKGSHARPTVLERSDHFLTIAVSRILLAPDPIQPDHLLVSHAKSRHCALTPTLLLQIQSLPNNPDQPYITFQGTHTLRARDLIENRSDTLHRQLLSQHLQHIIGDTTDPIPVATLYALSPHSSPFQVQRSLNDLFRMGLIQRPARGFYAPTPDNPVFPLKVTAATKKNPELANQLKVTTATKPDPKLTNQLKVTAATTPDPKPAESLKVTAATTPDPKPADSLKVTATTKPDPKLTNQLKVTAATTHVQSDRTGAYREMAIV